MLTRFLFLTLLLTAGCSSTEKTVEQKAQESPVSEETTSTETSLPVLLEKNRTQLSDRFALHQNDIPDEFSKKIVEEEPVINPFEGFRIQVFSGVSVANADSIASQFRAWSDTTIAGYQAETYTFFKTPYYRVHVGDFHSRKRAIDFSRLVKRKFRDAWVVYDRVNPQRVPADTAEFNLKQPESRN